MNGIVLLDKPEGLYSATAVTTVKRMIPRGTKIGHAGTLDPFATGLLILLIGAATKRCEAIMNQPKRYEATIRLGATTETDDPTSPEHPFKGATPPELSTLLESLNGLRGDISQVPPAYSALKIKGKRASDRVRSGQDIQLEPRIVHIYDIALINYTWPEVQIRVDCGRGTYVRSIARDLGINLGVGGYLSQLRRTRIGRFTIQQAVTLKTLRASDVATYLIADEPA